MSKLISLMHVSLDGFCAAPGGEMSWIGYDNSIFADAIGLTHRAGAAVYGRNTYNMMRGYWPALLDKTDSPEGHHARWVEEIPKLTFSRSMTGSDWNNVHLRRGASDILKDKQDAAKDLLIFGSPTLVHAFLELDAIDEFWMFQNPVLLGAGIPYFKGAVRTKLALAEKKQFDNGVIRLHYVKGQ